MTGKHVKRGANPGRREGAFETPTADRGSGGKASRGRPPRHQRERLRKNRTFRVRPVLDSNLVAAAATSCRSVSEEIEFRLEQSFDRDAFLGIMLGDGESAKALQAIAMVMKLESREGLWLRQADNSAHVRRATDFILAQLSEQRSIGAGWFQHPSDAQRGHDVTPEMMAYQALNAVKATGTYTNLLPGY